MPHVAYINFVGGRDYVGRPIISLTQPEQNTVEDLMELTYQELLDMFAYFTSVPRCCLLHIYDTIQLLYAHLHSLSTMHVEYIIVG